MNAAQKTTLPATAWVVTNPGLFGHHIHGKAAYKAAFGAARAALVSGKDSRSVFIAANGAAWRMADTAVKVLRLRAERPSLDLMARLELSREEPAFD